MDKRKFLKSTLAGAGALGVPGAAQAGNRLYGAPGSVIPINPAVANRMRLTLSRLSVPTDVWDTVVNTALAIQELALPGPAQGAFAASPGQYFADRGVPSMGSNSRDVAMARLALDPVAQAAASRGDYPAFLQRLKEFRLGAMPSPGGLIESVTSLLKSNAKFFAATRDAIEGARNAGPQALLGAIASPKTLDNETWDTIAIDTDVLVYETVVAMIDVVVGAEVLVLAAVVATVVVLLAGLDNLGKTGHAYEPRLARLDPSVLDFAANATMGARLLGNRDFEVSIAKDLVKQEIEAFVSAVEAVGLISVPAGRHAELVDFTFERACDGLGLA
jgi:hypothetical protein